MDPFNELIKHKITRFKANTTSSLLKDRIEKVKPQKTRERARTMARPLDKNERKRLSKDALQAEDKRLMDRRVLMTQEYIEDEIKKLFSENM